MANDKKELMKKFKVVVEDLLDHYDLYTDEEKAQIQEVFAKVAELNKVLDKYDVETKIEWQEYLMVAGQYFDTIYH